VSAVRLLAASAFVALTGACDGGDSADGDDDDATDSTPGDTDEPTPSDTDTTITDIGPVTRLEAACVATANVLRYECTVSVEPAQAVQLTFARADGLSAVRTVTSDANVIAHVLPLYFMAPEQAYDVTVSPVAWPESVVTTSLTTAATPPFLATRLEMTGTSTMGMIGTHLPCSSAATAVVYDTTTGDLLWYQNLDADGTLGSNDMVVFTEDHTVLGESEGDVVEVDLTGADVIRLNSLDQAFGVEADGLFGNFHHDIAKANGFYYVFYQENYGGNDVLDTVIIFDGTGAEMARWYPIDHVALPPNWGGDYLHTNAISVDPAGDIYLSWLTQTAVAKIAGDWTSPDYGAVLWMLNGDGVGAFGTITTDWSAVGAPNSFSDEHSVNIRPDGRLQLLDNDAGRGLVFTIDELTNTATVDATYDTREDTCGPQGTSRSTLGGNAIVGCTGDWIREYDEVTRLLLWEAEVQCPAGGGGGASRWYSLDGW
jgi:hypothetical protein